MANNLAIQEAWGSKTNRSILYWDVSQVTEMGEPKELMLVVLKNGIRGYIPLKETGVEPHENRRITRSRMEILIGQEVPFIVLNVDASDKFFGASIKMAREKLFREYANKIQEGAVYPGIIRRIHRSGMDLKARAIIVEVLGMECIMPLSEVAFGWITDPEEIVSVGDHLQVQMLQFNKDKPDRPIVSRKALQENPWDSAEYHVGDSAYGRVTGIRNNGLQLTLKEGISAFVGHRKSGSVNEGDHVSFRITRIDPPTDSRRQGALIGSIIKHTPGG